MLQVGDKVPEFTLPDQKGQMVSPSQFRGKKLVIYFYPKDNTPGCTTEACGLRDSHQQITDKNAIVLVRLLILNLLKNFLYPLPCFPTWKQLQFRLSVRGAKRKCAARLIWELSVPHLL